MFVAVVGPSGAGKDTLLRAAAETLTGRKDFVFVRRVVTRPSDTASEDHDTLTPEAFDDARDAGAFILSWGAHGLNYGLPAKSLDDVQAGRTVVANVSRAALTDAANAFPRLAVIEVTARTDILAARIAARGRESIEAARRRADRDVELKVPARCKLQMSIDNSGAREVAQARFIEALLAVAQPR